MPQLIQPYLTISRETGIDAGELAHAIATKCGWKVFDRELLDYLAEHDHLSRLALDFVDERTRSWFHEIFGKWLDQQLISQAEYVSRLGRIVLLAAQHESTVFVGAAPNSCYRATPAGRCGSLRRKNSASNESWKVAAAASAKRRGSSRTPTWLARSLFGGIFTTTWPIRSSTTLSSI